jgi:hypothetical protein
MIMEAPTAIPGVLATTVRVVAGLCSATSMVSVGVVVEVTAGNIPGPYFFCGFHLVYHQHVPNSRPLRGSLPHRIGSMF